MRPSISKSILGGLVGTVVMTLLMYAFVPLLLGRPMDIAAMLAGVLGLSWSGGMIAHFVIGTILIPVVYAVLYPRLSGAPVTRGLVYGLLLWIIAEAIVMPIGGAGFFHIAAGGLLAVIASLIGHLAYGAVLGGMAGRATEAYRGTAGFPEAHRPEATF